MSGFAPPLMPLSYQDLCASLMSLRPLSRPLSLLLKRLSPSILPPSVSTLNMHSFKEKLGTAEQSWAELGQSSWGRPEAWLCGAWETLHVGA